MATDIVQANTVLWYYPGPAASGGGDAASVTTELRWGTLKALKGVEDDVAESDLCAILSKKQPGAPPADKTEVKSVEELVLSRQGQTVAGWMAIDYADFKYHYFEGKANLALALASHKLNTDPAPYDPVAAGPLKKRGGATSSRASASATSGGASSNGSGAGAREMGPNCRPSLSKGKDEGSYCITMTHYQATFGKWSCVLRAACRVPLPSTVRVAARPLPLCARPRCCVLPAAHCLLH